MMAWFKALWVNSQPQSSWIGLVQYPLISKYITLLGLKPTGFWAKWFVWNFWRNPFGFLLQTMALPRVDSPTFNPNGGFLFIRWFMSYRGKFIEFYVGFRPDGIFGMALRKAHSRNQKGQPG